MMNDDKISLRALEPTDLDTLYRWENDANLWAVSDTSAPYSRQVLWSYLEQYTADIYQSRQLRLMIVDGDGQAVGTVDFYHFDALNNRAEMGLYVAPELRGRGYGCAALRLALRYAEAHVGMRQVYVYIRTDNIGCLRLYEQAGFRTVGTLQSWVKRGHAYHDVMLLQKML